MFKMFTWGQYLGALAIVLTLYYLYVAAVYYREEIMALVKGKGKGRVGARPSLVGPATARPSMMGDTGPLISKSALIISTPPLVGESPVDATNEQAPDGAESDPDTEEETETNRIDFINKDESTHDIVTNFVSNSNSDELPGSEEVTGAGQPADHQPDFSVGVSQLGDYLQAASEGKITQKELVKQVPELDNTALLVAFFQTNAKAAQRLTSRHYVDVPEPVLD